MATGAFTVDPGAYEILIARSAEDIVLTAPLTVTGTAPGPRTVVDRRTLAVDFDDHAAITLVDASRTEGDAVTLTEPDRPATLLFRSVDLTGAARVKAELAREDAEGEASVEFRAGGRELARIAVPVTGGRYVWTTVAAELTGTAPTGEHDLTLVLRGRFRLAAFRFESSQSKEARSKEAQSKEGR